MSHSTRRVLITIMMGALLAALMALVGCGAGNTKSNDAPKSTNEPATAVAAAEPKAEYDVVVVGSGGAGMSAALTAHEAGASVVILEKLNGIGGNSNFSSSGMNASETKFEKEQGIEDSNDLFIEETFKGGHETGNKELVTYLAKNSASAIDWLDAHGIRLDNLTITGGFSVKRCHRPTDGSAVGGVLVKGLKDSLDKAGVEIFKNYDVKKINMEGDKVVGVTAQTKSGEKVVKAKAVVIATGGFGANSEMVEKLRPEYKGMVTTNQEGTNGDGIKMAEAVGAQTIDLKEIQIHPTVEQKSSALIAEGMRGAGGILVNKAGERFYNEMDTRDKVSAAELQQDGKFAWLILDSTIKKNNKALEKYIKRKLTTEGATIEELAKAIELDPAKLAATVEAYNKIAAANGEGDPFGRKTGFAELKTGPFYAIKVAPGVHHTMGGIKINVDTQVLGQGDKPITGLYAAGEVTGGIHGANRIGGNAVCDIVVNGRNAGQHASEFAKK